MRKLAKIIGILLIILPLRVNALTGSISINCDKTIAPGSSTTCRIVGNSDGDVSGVAGVIELGSGLTLSSADKDNIWQGSGEGGLFDVYTDNNQRGTFNVGSFVITASSSITSGAEVSIKMKNIVFTDPAIDFQDVSIGDASTSIRIASTVNTLSSLTVSGATINFNANTTTYNVTIDASSTTISATATDSKASVSGTGTKTLNYGANTFNVTVTSESGATKTYTINITRPKPQTKPDNNNNQSTNKPSTGGNNNNTSSNNNNNNSNSKEEEKSNNNYLGSLKVNGKDLKITKDETNYKLTVDNDIKELDISYKASDDKATIKLEGDKNLKIGENTFKIIVTAEDGSTKEYTLTVIRAEEGKKVSKNNYLKNLKIDNYDIDFNKNTLEYTIKIKDEASLKITATPEDSKAKARITGNNNLQDGSKVKIIVTAEDGSTREYTLNITKGGSLLLPIILGIILVIAIILFIILLWRRKKNNRK